MEKQLAEFTAGYIAALLWSSNDTCPVTGDMRDLDEYELSAAAAEQCRADCRAFFTANQADINAAAAAYPTREEHGGHTLAGHDFALTRNGHGAGYWDGDLPGEIGDRLTSAAEAAGEAWPYIGDDGMVYIA